MSDTQPTPPAPQGPQPSYPAPQPPAPQPAASPPAAQSDASRVGARALAITVTVLGAGALVVSGVGAAFATVGTTMYSSTAEEATSSLPAAVGDDALDIDLQAGELDIRFADVDEVEFRSRTSQGAWTFDRSGGTIVVSSPRGEFNLFGPGNWGERAEATLTLPESYEGIDLDVDVAAGEFTAEGVFGEVTYGMEAGSLEIEGSAETVASEMAAGRAVLELDSVRTADLTVMAGRLDADFTGDPPEAVSVDLTAGSAELTLPDVPYDVSVQREAGNVESSLEERSDADRTVDIDVAAGHVALYAS
ncbi:DUF4097 family beta strand repeat-containing protein [Microbacterium sp. G2-8]|uniref:DUF4097 family beta strand repeat-containing protein n=1 Tax=Microbacterium sp. G2-8 TaxID=2842454 RepID=UPI001C895178|nr:DUF4097 family beta strand repeat-containing protein [Microbacterium sp. G2-8]